MIILACENNYTYFLTKEGTSDCQYFLKNMNFEKFFVMIIRKMEQIGLRFLERSDISNFFEVNNNDFVKTNFDAVLKMVTFYTVAIFETDSVEQKITFILNGEQVCKSIPEACEMLFPFMSRCHENRTNGLPASTYGDLNKLEQFVSDQHDDLREALIDHPVAKYTIRNDKYKATVTPYDAPYCLPKYELDEKKGYINVWNSNDYPTKGKIIGEFPGYWDTPPDYTMGYPVTFDEESISSYEEHHHNIFNFDEFGIVISKKSDFKYKAKFTSVYEIHHASEVWCRDTTVEVETTYIDKWNFEYINTVTILIENENEDKLKIHTYYYAIDCL